MKRKHRAKISTSSAPAYIAMVILAILVSATLSFLFYFLLSALGIWVASLCFDFAFKWIYAVGAGIVLMILSSLFSGSKS